MQETVVASEPWMLVIDDKPLDLPADPGGPLSRRLATLEKSVVSELEKRNLHAVKPSEEAPALLDRATNLIRIPPGLESIVRRCTHEISPLHVPNDSFDVSHSEPRWPTRIFVSVPKHSPVGDLRIAEAIVHESMHLNLTFLELRTQLTNSTTLLYSPWKSEPRPASGVLHGIYVFACIWRFFSYLLGRNLLGDQARRHVEQRREEIRIEISLIDRPDFFRCLTTRGQELACMIFSRVD
jgi:HEXXH motif-containing protein